jgi:hypothetical protein
MRACCRSAVFCLLLVATPIPAAAWAARTHRLVTDLALDILPGHCAATFREHRRELLNRSVEPDTVLREREGHREAIRHYIDLDAYMPYPFAGFPHSHRAATKRYGRRTVEERGLLPWVILRLERELESAVRRGDTGAMLQKAGYLSHYVADAYQPLHLTANHDGQKTGNDGVHQRLEVGAVDDRIEQYGSALRRHLPAVQRVTNLRQELFDGFDRTYPLVATILRADDEARQAVGPPGPLYYRRMDAALHSAIERQLGTAAGLLASIWYTACENARPAPP